MDIHEVPRPRIATGQLAQHIGQPVCFVGRVEKVGGVWQRGWGCPGAVPGAARQLQAAWEQGGRRTDTCGKELAEATKALALPGAFGARRPNVFFRPKCSFVDSF